MLKRLLHAQIRKMERRYGYDGGYMHEVLDASLPAFLKFGLFQIMSMHRDQVPKDAWYAARLAAALSEDCGPCSQLDFAVASSRVYPTVKRGLGHGAACTRLTVSGETIMMKQPA